MLAFGKTRNLQKVLELHEMAATKHNLKQPSMQRMNSILFAYCRTGEPEKAEQLMTEMREKMGMAPDVVCHMTLIDGYNKKGNLDKCWEIYHQCMAREQPGQDVDEQMISYMIRICSKIKQADKAMRLFNDLQLDRANGLAPSLEVARSNAYTSIRNDALNSSDWWRISVAVRAQWLHVHALGPPSRPVLTFTCEG